MVDPYVTGVTFLILYFSVEFLHIGPSAVTILSRKFAHKLRRTIFRMFLFPNTGVLYRRIICVVAMVSLFAVASAYSQTSKRVYDVELVVSNGKKSVETDADITFYDDKFTVVPDKAQFKSSTKEIAYKDITQADHSYSKKPMLSGGGAIATALLVGFIVALPFLFIKKKKHWMTVQAGEGNFAVVKLGDQNFRQIVAEMQTHGVKVNELKEEGK